MNKTLVEEIIVRAATDKYLGEEGDDRCDDRRSRGWSVARGGRGASAGSAGRKKKVLQRGFLLGWEDLMMSGGVARYKYHSPSRPRGRLDHN